MVNVHTYSQCSQLLRIGKHVINLIFIGIRLYDTNGLGSRGHHRRKLLVTAHSDPVHRIHPGRRLGVLHHTARHVRIKGTDVGQGRRHNRGIKPMPVQTKACIRHHTVHEPLLQ